jgi:hypothetical protein
MTQSWHDRLLSRFRVFRSAVAAAMLGLSTIPQVYPQLVKDEWPVRASIDVPVGRILWIVAAVRGCVINNLSNDEARVQRKCDRTVPHQPWASNGLESAARRSDFHHAMATVMIAVTSAAM